MSIRTGGVDDWPQAEALIDIGGIARRRRAESTASQRAARLPSAPPHGIEFFVA